MNREEEEIRQFTEGSRAAFEALVIRYRQPAVWFARQYVHDFHSAEDLVQDCFAYLYVYPERYDFRSSFRTYLYTIIRHKCVDHLRKLRRRRECSEPPEGREGSGQQGSDPAFGPEQRFIVREDWLEWQRRLSMLKDGYRTAIYLVDVEGCTPQEAAGILGKSSAGFRVTLHRARRKLRETVEKEVREREGRKLRESGVSS